MSKVCVAQKMAAGLLEVCSLDRAAIRSLPSWRGTQVTTGDLFRGDLHGRPYFVLVTASAKATFLPFNPTRVSAADYLGELAVTWVPAQ